MEEQHSSSRLSTLIAGILLGLLIFAIGLFVKAVFFSQSSDPVVNVPQVLELQIKTPSENLATNESKVEIAGSTGIKSVVTINSAEQTKILNAANRSFSTEITLTSGKNLITITAFDTATGNSVSQQRTILYLIEGLADL